MLDSFKEEKVIILCDVCKTQRTGMVLGWLSDAELRFWIEKGEE